MQRLRIKRTMARAAMLLLMMLLTTATAWADNEATGIKTTKVQLDGPEGKVNYTNLTNYDTWYTLDGRRVAKPTQKGVYVHTGRKVVVK